jgi:hypothetical protein
MRMKKYRGSNPHKTYAPMPKSMPAVVSFAKGLGPVVAAGFCPGGGDVVSGAAWEVRSGMGTLSITAVPGQVFQPEHGQTAK